MGERGTIGMLAGAVALVVGALAGVPHFVNQAAAETGVCLSKPLTFADGTVSGCLAAAEVEALKDRRVSLGANPKVDGLTLTHPTDYNKQRKVATCRQYDQATTEGWYAMSTFDIAMEGYFKRDCGVLRSIAKGARAKSSFLGSTRDGLADVEELSARALRPMLPDAAGGTVGDLVKGGAITIGTRSPERVALTSQGMDGELVALARGDFNGDGLEDLLTLCAVHAEGGSFRAYDLLVLTRRSANGPLEIVSDESAG